MIDRNTSCDETKNYGIFMFLSLEVFMKREFPFAKILIFIGNTR